MSRAGVRHPTDDERAAATAPIVAATATALRDRDAAALADVVRADAAWLSPDGHRPGAESTVAAMLAASEGAEAWREPAQIGAAAVLGFTRGGVAAAIVLTVRRDGVVLAAGA